MTYFDVEGDKFGMFSTCTVIIDVNGFKGYRYGTLHLAPNTNILKVYFYNELPKGTHSIRYDHSDTWTEFTYQ